MAFVGMAPFGSPLAGSVADRIGTTMTLLVSGVLCIAGAVLFWSHLEVVRREVRPIYRELGILPQIAEGIQQATQLQWPPQE
jgi:MFS family permease